MLPENAAKPDDPGSESGHDWRPDRHGNLALVRVLGPLRSCAGLRGALDRCRASAGVVWSARTHKGVDYGAPACFRLEVLGANRAVLSAFGDLVPDEAHVLQRASTWSGRKRKIRSSPGISARESVGDVEPGRRGGRELALTSLPRLGVQCVGLPRMPESTRGWALRLADLLGVRPEDATEEDLSRLVTGRVREDADLDFKQECYGNSDPARRDLAGDVAAMANTRGGLIIIGIRDENDVAVELTPVKLGDGEEARIRRIAASDHRSAPHLRRSGLEQRRQ